MANDRKTKQSGIRPDLYITVYHDQSGGYFSLAGGKPEPLASLEADPSIREILNYEYDELLHSITRGENPNAYQDNLIDTDSSTINSM